MKKFCGWSQKSLGLWRGDLKAVQQGTLFNQIMPLGWSHRWLQNHSQCHQCHWCHPCHLPLDSPCCIKNCSTLTWSWGDLPLSLSHSECCVALTSSRHWLPTKAQEQVLKSSLLVREAYQHLKCLTSLWVEILPPKLKESPHMGFLFTCKVTWIKCPCHHPLSWIHSRQ